MPDETTGGEAQGGDDHGTPQEGGEGSGSQTQDLNSATTDELVGLVKELRRENAKWRNRTHDAEETASEVSNKVESMTERLRELEDANKSAEEKERERLQILEETAAKAGELQDRIAALARYEEHVSSQLTVEMERIDKLEDERKTAYTDLLGAFREDDHLGRLKAIQAIKAAEKARGEMQEGDHRNPGETGKGRPKHSAAARLAWSSSGLKESQAVDRVLNPSTE